jgi:putative (di)nucleoside polyphosphate hydrolase
MIDADGFRANVGIILANAAGQVLWARRCNNPEAWQFPQGGMHEGESPIQSMYRELNEELGLNPEDVEYLAETPDWLSYLLPEKYRRPHSKPLCIGQKQKWFLLRLISSEDKIKLDHSPKPEFDTWRWVDYWYPLEAIVEFKREVYQAALSQLEAIIVES